MSKRRFAARQSEFDAVRAFIEASLPGMQRDDCERVILLVEELFANSVAHGYGGDSDAPVWISVTHGKHGCRVVYEDRAPPYDPFAAATDGLVDADLEDRPIGGLGVVLLVQLSSRHEYRRRGNHNVIEFEVPAR